MSATVDAHSCLSLVALITRRDLLFCAKYLFVAAIGRARAYMAGGFKSASTPENPDNPWFFSENAHGDRAQSPWGRALAASAFSACAGGGGGSSSCYVASHAQLPPSNNSERT